MAIGDYDVMADISISPDAWSGLVVHGFADGVIAERVPDGPRWTFPKAQVIRSGDLVRVEWHIGMSPVLYVNGHRFESTCITEGQQVITWKPLEG
jgi:hypothetical protein